MDDDLAENVLRVAGEVAVDKVLGSREDDCDFLLFMEGFPAGSKFISKACVGLLSGAPVFTMMKLGRRLQRKAARSRSYGK